MKKWFYKVLLVICELLTITEICASQNLNFSYPANYLSEITTDHAVDITNFNGGFFVTWKNTGNTGNIGICYLGRQHESNFIEQKQSIDNQSAFAPVLRVFKTHIYAFWIGIDGSLKYVINNSATSFDVSKIYTLNAANSIKFAGGITAASVGENIMIASHNSDKNHMIYALLQPIEDGSLRMLKTQNIENAASETYPFVVPLSSNTARITFKGYKSTALYYADFDINANTWTNKLPILTSKSNASPAVYSVFNSGKLFYIWKGQKGDNHLYYSTGTVGSGLRPETILPGYFSTNYPVSICDVDEQKFILSYVGEDNKLYISYFTNYNSANWMETELMQRKQNLTLKDVVLPGSHDAGLSVLNGVGGTQSGSINECNTLTQSLDIAHQLNAGIRMFDLRIGTYKGEFYTKHCASDCMADAIGGAYGEKFSVILNDVHEFLQKNKKEFILITLSHFCDRETPMTELTTYINNKLGNEMMYNNEGKNISQIKLKDLAGKAIITFEGYAYPQKNIDSSSMTGKSHTFLNIRREYAATNKIDLLLTKQKIFFSNLSNSLSPNDIVRLDWQLTQSVDEAAMVCNDFENSKANPLIDGAMLLTNVVRKHKSIIDLSIAGNKYISKTMNDWIKSGLIDKNNKPNILYVDSAGAWITDYCIELNRSEIYN